MTSAPCLFLLSVSLAWQSGANTDLRVRVAAARAADRCLTEATIVTQPLDGGAVSVRAEAPGCWSTTETAFATDGREIVPKMYVAAQVSGVLAADHDRWPSKMHGLVFASPAAPSEDALPARDTGHLVHCELDRPRWRCVVPADAAFDLRLNPEGFAPIHYWDVIAPATGDKLLEPRTLHVGASLSGWVEGPEGEPISGARVLLTPATHAEGETSRIDARTFTARTNHRGFFQFAGLDAGEYKLVSRADKWPPAVLPVVNIRENEALRWPRAITHLPPAELVMLFEPPADSEGKPWMVSLSEAIPISSPPPPALRRPAAEGSWRAANLRADSYRVMVEDSRGSVLERFLVDLSASGTTTIPVNLNGRMIRGVLRFGKEPLEAEIRFAHRSGRFVKTKTSDRGEFQLSFPLAGQWSPTVYPGGTTGPSIKANDITVPDQPATESMEIVLGGGRLRGVVVNRTGTKEKAVVHLSRRGKLIGEFLTEDDGEFDFIGLDAGDYLLQAQAESGSARLDPASVPDSDTLAVTLRLEPYSKVSALVLSPSQAPVGGATVRISTDGGLSWTDLFTDVEGRFEYYTEAGSPPLRVIILTHAYPALIAQLHPTSDHGVSTLELQPRGGKLRVNYPSYVGKERSLAPLQMFYVPPSPLGLYDGAAYLEPGVYSICSGNVPDSRCRTVTIHPGTEQTIRAQDTEESSS